MNSDRIKALAEVDYFVEKYSEGLEPTEITDSGDLTRLKSVEKFFMEWLLGDEEVPEDYLEKFGAMYALITMNIEDKKSSNTMAYLGGLVLLLVYQIWDKCC